MSADKPFRFKKFEVHQSRSAMKVGTDGVLLAAWTDISEAKNLLDVGTGTGVIALICAQRNMNCQITAIEIDKHSCEDASENFAMSPWADRLQLVEGDFLKTDFPYRFDHIVANPPYFSKSLPASDPGRRAARHDESLPAESFLKHTREVLSEVGKVAVIFPKNMLERWSFEAEQCGLHPVRVCHVFTLPSKDSTRVMVEFARHIDRETSMESILVEKRPGEYSEPYKELMKDYYSIFT